MDLPVPIPRGLPRHLVKAVLAILAVYLVFLRKRKQLKVIKRQIGCYDSPIRYNVTSPASMPKITGFALKISQYIFTSRFAKWMLIPNAHERMNFPLIEYLVLDEAPTYQPRMPFDGPASDGTPVDLEPWIAKDQETDGGFMIVKDQETTGDKGFRFATISDFYHQYRSGTLTPNEVAENVIQAIKDSEKLTPKLRAMVDWDESEIRKMAAASTERLQQNKPLSVMDGVPVSIKDEFSVIPYILRVGTQHRATKSTVDATVAEKLRAAGAMIIGMANMHELGTGTTGNNVSRYHGTARNPYNLDHYPGGSSSGSASSVASGLCVASIGTDGGGSVRLPAIYCGLVGYKATYGRFSAAGCAPLAFTVSHTGPLCTSVRDAAIMYGILAGPDERDANSASQPPVTLDGFNDTNLSGIKMGVYHEYNKDADPEIVDTCEKAIQYLQGQGAESVDIEIAEMEEMRVAHIIAIGTEFSTGMKQDLVEQPMDLSAEVTTAMASSSQVTARTYITANKQRTRSINFLKNHVFDKVDVIITPASAITAPKIYPDHLSYGLSDQILTAKTMRYVWIGNLTGIPCISVPVGYDKQGLPMGVQIMGRWWEDHMVLRIGNVLEGFIRNKYKQPQVYYDTLKK